MNRFKIFEQRISRILIAALIGFSSITIQAKTWEKTYDFQQPAASVTSLNVQLRDADLQVSGNASANSITVNVIHQVQGGSEEDAQRYFENESVFTSMNGSTFEVKNVVSKPKWGLFNNYQQHHSKVTIVCPPQLAAQLRTSDGNLTISDLNSEIELTTSDGDIEIENINGNLSLITSDGDVDIRNMKGMLEARTSDGDISIENLTGSIQAKTSDGDIEVHFASNPTGDCELFTSDGDVELSLQSTTSLLIHTRVSDGNIENHLSNSTTLFEKRHRQEIKIGEGEPKVTIQTSDGDISLKS